MSSDSSAPGEEAGRSAASCLSRPGARAGLLLSGALALLFACGPRGLSHGVWLSGDGDEQYALVFEHTGGLLSGSMHHLVEGRQADQWRFVGTRTGAGELELSWGGGNSMTVSVNLDLDELEGTAQLANGRVLEGLFLRRDAREIPGFAALPDLPYRLRPPAPGSGWEIAEPAAVGLSERHLEKTVRAVTRGEAGLLHSLVIVRRGKLVVEEYFHGYAREDLHRLHSVTKSVTSLLVGIARDRGAVGSLDTPVLEWFPEHAAAAGPGWENVTLEHLLTMTAGLDWDRRETLGDNLAGPEIFAKVFGRRVVQEPGSRWLYNDSDIELLGGVLRRATGMQADELAAQALFAPLEITAWDWHSHKTEGYPLLSGALRLRPLDMAKIGLLVLDRGHWRGRPVVSEEWVAQSTAPRIVTGAGSQKYGYLWSRLDAPIEAGPDPVLLASGWGSQFIHIIPVLEAVIVTTGGNHHNNKAFAIGEVLLRELLPGVER